MKLEKGMKVRVNCDDCPAKECSRSYHGAKKVVEEIWETKKFGDVADWEKSRCPNCALTPIEEEPESYHGFKVGERVRRENDIGRVCRWSDQDGLHIEEPDGSISSGKGWPDSESIPTYSVPFIREDNGCACWSSPERLRRIREEAPSSEPEKVEVEIPIVSGGWVCPRCGGWNISATDRCERLAFGGICTGKRPGGNGLYIDTGKGEIKITDKRIYFCGFPCPHCRATTGEEHAESCPCRPASPEPEPAMTRTRRYLDLLDELRGEWIPPGVIAPPKGKRGGHYKGE